MMNAANSETAVQYIMSMDVLLDFFDLDQVPLGSNLLQWPRETGVRCN